MIFIYLRRSLAVVNAVRNGATVFNASVNACLNIAFNVLFICPSINGMVT